MECPKCHQAVESSELGQLSPGEKGKALITDWRVWALAFGVNLAAGVGGSILHLGTGIGLVSGAGVGAVIAFRAKGLRRCPRCNAAAHFPDQPW